MQLIEEAYIDKNLPKDWKPYYVYQIIVDENVVGRVILRLGTIQERYYDGHIGYTIDEEYRGHHYAYLALLKVKDIAIEKGFQELVITCSPNNVASKKTILKLNAIYIETKSVPSSLRKYFSKEETEKEIYIWKL